MKSGYTPTTNPNKKLYNAGSEWQDDIEGLADYYSTFFREYDAIIGRFNGVDPLAEMTDEISTYAYANNNPVMMNDPLADYKAWHDPQYGDNSSRYTVDRLMAMWGWGDWSGGGGGGGYEGSYQQLKDNINSYGHEAWREINADALREYFENLWSGTDGISIGVRESGGVKKGKGFNVTWYQDIPTSEGSLAAGGKFVSIAEAVNLLEKEREPTQLEKGIGGFQKGFTLTDLTTISTSEKASRYIAGNIYGVRNFSKAKTSLKTATGFKNISRGLGAANIILTGVDAFTNPDGPQIHHGIDAVIGVASIVFPVFGIVYGIFDIGFQIFTGKSISQHIENAIKDN